MARSRRPSPQSDARPSDAHPNDAKILAALYAQARSTLVAAGRALHDDIGGSLSAAGVRLQLLRTDVPAARDQIDQALQVLDETLEHVRTLSQELCPSPAHRGSLKQALLRLAEQPANSTRVEVEYSATAVAPPEIAVGLYEAAAAAVAEAVRRRARRVRVKATGARGIVLRIADDGPGRGRTRALSATRHLARAAGLAFDVSAGKSTIVTIRYAVRRPSRG